MRPYKFCARSSALQRTADLGVTRVVGKRLICQSAPTGLSIAHLDVVTESALLFVTITYQIVQTALRSTCTHCTEC